MNKICEYKSGGLLSSTIVAVIMLGIQILYPVLGYASNPLTEEEFRIRLENRHGGAIAVSTDKGKQWKVVGKVLQANNGRVLETDDYGFTAADSIQPGTIAATAVNALHIKVRQGNRHAVLFTIQPGDFLKKKSDQVKSYFSPSSSIFTDIKAGTAIFGSDFGPRVGTRVFLKKNDQYVALPSDYLPSEGDILLIISHKPAIELSEIRIQNRKGGFVSVLNSEGALYVVGKVQQPVNAVGRFSGSEFADRGEVRANHAGVICISTSPLGKVGGFQIVPSAHAREPHLGFMWESDVAAWVIIGPVLPGKKALDGQPPLFSGHIRPRTGRCFVRINDGPFQAVPELCGVVRNGLANVTEIKIQFNNSHKADPKHLN